MKVGGVARENSVLIHSLIIIPPHNNKLLPPNDPLLGAGGGGWVESGCFVKQQVYIYIVQCTLPFKIYQSSRRCFQVKLKLPLKMSWTSA